MKAMVRCLHVLTGPTAVGKTELALRWAERHDAEIVSCDSLLFYRGMNIGTAKPTVAERARVPHHLIDSLDVKERADVTWYVAQARHVVDDLLARGRSVLVTGGSGFYLKAFFGPVADDVSVPEVVREEVARILEHDGLPALVDRLREINPDGLGTLDLANPRRVTRALERCLASGRTLRALAEAFSNRPGPFADYEVRCVRLDREPSELNERIVSRVRRMIADGLETEVVKLRAEGLESNPSAAGAIGYRETLAMLDGRLAREAWADAIIANTKALVKKQRTWFRTQLPPHPVWPAGATEADDLFADVLK